MVRTQIYLTENEKKVLATLAEETGKSQSALIREAIDRFIDEVEKESRLERLRQARGLWKDREDLPEISDLREEWDRAALERSRG